MEERVAKVEERTARVETSVDHIRENVSELKTSVQRLDDRVDRVESRLASKLDFITQAIADLRVGQMRDRVWYLLQFIVLLGILGKAFKWI